MKNVFYLMLFAFTIAKSYCEEHPLGHVEVNYEPNWGKDEAPIGDYNTVAQVVDHFNDSISDLFLQVSFYINYRNSQCHMYAPKA